MDFKEWQVRFTAIIIIAYMLLFGFPRLAKCEDLARSIGNSPQKIVQEVNIVIPATPTNCVEVSKFVYNIMYCNQYSELYLIGVWKGTQKGHMFVAFKDTWGQQYIVSTGKYQGKYTTMLAKSKDIEQFCDYWNPEWTHYFIYKKDGKVLTRRNR